MQRCFTLARKGKGLVSPNPLVGAVLVAQERIIGEGWHKVYGGHHAEVNALQSVAAEDRHLLPQSSLYVNLEPCNHFGKTPPCVNLILEHNIRKVIIGNIDPFIEVAGKGIQRLKQHNVEVVSGILEKEGKWLNRRFFTVQENNRPYIILKWAQSIDGLIAKENEQTAISHPRISLLNHEWRNQEDAILVGTTTATIDNPRLSVREVPVIKQPTRVIIDRKLSIPNTYHIYDQNQQTIILNTIKETTKNNLQFCHIDFDNNFIFNLLQLLNKQKIQSVIIEGGTYTLQQFINQNMWDEARIITSNTSLFTGISAPIIKGIEYKTISLANNEISYLLNSTL